MLGAALGLGEALGTRFRVLGMLPMLLFAGFVAALVEAGAPSEAPNLDQAADALSGLETWEGVLLVLGIIAAALLAEPLQLSLVRALEGYWGGSGLAAKAAWPLVKWQARGLERETKINEQPQRVDAARGSLAAWRLEALYSPDATYEPEPTDLLPTRLGNVLRAAERRAGRRYGLDAVVVWPRLFPLLSDRLTGALDDQRGQMDVAARFCAMFVLSAAVSAGLLWQHGWWLAVPVIALVLAVLSYRAAIAAAIAYGVTIEAAVDLHRFDLLEALHLPLPPDRRAERKANEALTRFLLQGVPVDFHYSHAEEPAPAERSDAVPPREGVIAPER